MTESCLSVKMKELVWKDYIARIMNEDMDWDNNVQGDAVEAPVVCVNREEVLQASNKIKAGKAPEPSDESLELIAVSRGVGIQVNAGIYLRFLDGFGMPVG